MEDRWLSKPKNFKNEQKSSTPSNLSIPDIIQYFHVFLAVLACVIGGIHATISIYIGGHDWKLAVAIVVSWAVILGVVLPRLFVICLPYDRGFKYIFLFISLPTIPLLYFLFVAKAKKIYRITYSQSDVLPWLILAGNYIAFYYSMKLSYYRGNNWIQGLLAPVCTAAMIELGQVWRVKMVDVNGMEFEDEPKMSSQEPEKKKLLESRKDQVIGLQINEISDDLTFLY